MRPKRAAHSELRVDHGQCKFSTSVETLDSGREALCDSEAANPTANFNKLLSAC